MKMIYLFSKKRSVLNYWSTHIAPIYEVEMFYQLKKLYDTVEKNPVSIIFFDYDGEPEIAKELLTYFENNENAPFVMIFNSHPLFSDGIELIRYGAKAFMNTYSAPQNLNQAIKAVLAGNIWLYPEFIQMMIKQTIFSQIKNIDILNKLSSREYELAQMVKLGMSNKEIAKNANITEQTVKTHLKTIYEKLGVGTRLELALLLSGNRDSY